MRNLEELFELSPTRYDRMALSDPISGLFGFLHLDSIMQGSRCIWRLRWPLQVLRAGRGSFSAVPSQDDVGHGRFG